MRLPGARGPRRAGVATLALVVAAGLGACDVGGSSGPDGEAGEAATKAAPDPPTPAERLGLRTGWGPTRAEL